MLISGSNPILEGDWRVPRVAHISLSFVRFFLLFCSFNHIRWLIPVPWSQSLDLFWPEQIMNFGLSRWRHFCSSTNVGIWWKLSSQNLKRLPSPQWTMHRKMLSKLTETEIAQPHGCVTEINSYGLGYHNRQLDSRNQSFPICNRNKNI